MLDIPAHLTLATYASPATPVRAQGIVPLHTPPPLLHRLLLLEDDYEVAHALATALSVWGLEVRIASSTHTALQQLHTWQPDMLVSDYQLEGGELATDVINTLHQHVAHPLPTLILTGNTHPTVIRELQQRQLPTLYKPIHLDVLKQAIHAQFIPKD